MIIHLLCKATLLPEIASNGESKCMVFVLKGKLSN